MLIVSIYNIPSDEEIGGGLGMATFTQSQEFKDLNIGFTLDEGCASADDAFNVFYAERTMWRRNI